MGRRTGMQKGSVMEINWKYKIDLDDSGVFDDIAEQRKTDFPEELRNFITAHNGASPDKYNFMIGINEKVFGAVLSFNRDEQDADTVYSAFEAISDGKLIPFAIDPFGNYICYETSDKQIVFWEHETGKYLNTELSLSEFLASLY